MPTPNINLTQYTANDVTSYLTNYNEDMSKIDTAVKAADDKGGNALTAAQAADTKAEDAASTANIADGKADSAITGLNQVAEILTTGVIQIYTHVKQGTIHNLIPTFAEGYPPTGNIRFKATAPFVEGDTFKVNSQNVVASLVNGETLPDTYFISGATVTCELEDSRLNFKGGGSSTSGLDFKFYTGDITNRPITAEENTVFGVVPGGTLTEIKNFSIVPVDTTVLTDMVLLTSEKGFATTIKLEPYVETKISEVKSENTVLTGYIFKNGIWNELKVTFDIFNNGEVIGYIWVTGGFPGTTTYNKTNAIYMKKNNNADNSIAGWRVPIETTPIATIDVVFDIATATNSTLKIGLTNDQYLGNITNEVLITGPGKYTMDISNVTGSNYLVIAETSPPGGVLEFSVSSVVATEK